MTSSCKMRCGRFVVMALIGLMLGSLAVMLLWNWLTPVLFGWKEIGFLQAAGLLALSKILFGSLHGHCGHGHWPGHLAERLEQMTPEERERFRAGMKAKGCGCGPAASEGAEGQ